MLEIHLALDSNAKKNPFLRCSNFKGRHKIIKTYVVLFIAKIYYWMKQVKKSDYHVSRRSFDNKIPFYSKLNSEFSMNLRLIKHETENKRIEFIEFVQISVKFCMKMCKLSDIDSVM